MARKPAERSPAAADAPTTRSRPCPRAMADRAGNDDFHQMLDDFAEQSAVGPGGLEGLISNR